MGKTVRDILKNERSYDEPDRTPNNITITNFDLLMYVVGIVGYFVDLGLDINIAVRYFLSGMMAEFGWTVAFILLPAFVNTAVSIRMYALDTKKPQPSHDEFTKRSRLRITFLALQMASVLRMIDAIIYALRSRRAGAKRDQATQRWYYGRMLDEDSDCALLRIFECFLEAAPQQVLQTCLLLRQNDELAVHQILSICSSVVAMGWCLAAYQRAIRFAQQDKLNVTWLGSALQTLWHFFVTLSRVISLSAIAYLYPHWTILACIIHILIMTIWLQFFDRSPFCGDNRLAQTAFSLALGSVYLFTYILSVERRTRYRYSVYYTICFVQNVICSAIWFVYANDQMKNSVYYHPVFVLCLVPYCVGIVFMVVYYYFLHPRVRKGVSDTTVTFGAGERFEMN